MEAKPGDLEGLAETSSKILQKEAAPAAPSEVSESPAQVDDVPDPDEDDLDDLDGDFLPPLLFKGIVAYIRFRYARRIYTRD